jgi:hypothetical protein
VSSTHLGRSTIGSTHAILQLLLCARVLVGVHRVEMEVDAVGSGAGTAPEAQTVRVCADGRRSARNSASCLPLPAQARGGSGRATRRWGRNIRAPRLCSKRGAEELRTNRVLGVEFEMELAVAAVHRPCAPLLGRLTDIPAPRRTRGGLHDSSRTAT